MKYKLNLPDLRNFKSKITERLVNHYINTVVKREYEEAGHILIFETDSPFNLFMGSSSYYAIHTKEKNLDWEKAFLEGRIIYESGDTSVVVNGQWQITGSRERKKWINKWKSEEVANYESIKRNIYLELLNKGIFPDSELIGKCMLLMSNMYNQPDGIIYKLEKTGKNISKSRVHKEIGSEFISEDLPDKIPLVKGNIEIVEVKSDTGFISGNQYYTYANAIGLGFPLHYFHVFVTSFIDNDFDVEEEVIHSPEKLKPLISKYLRKSREFTKRRKARMHTIPLNGYSTPRP